MSGDEITELTVTNPDDPGKGRVQVCDDGYLVWERLTDITGQVSEIVTGLLCAESPACPVRDIREGTKPGVRPHPLRGSGTRLASGDSTRRGRAG